MKYDWFNDMVLPAVKETIPNSTVADVSRGPVLAGILNSSSFANELKKMFRSRWSVTQDIIPVDGGVVLAELEKTLAFSSLDLLKHLSAEPLS